MAYDAIVIGLGAMGSATTAHLARRGQHVLGLDAHPRGHTLGSSHGRSRLIREVYYEGTGYVPLVQRAYALWRELEEESGCDLLRITGGLYIGPRQSELVEGTLRSGQLHNLPHELLTAAEVAERFPGFRLTDDLSAVYEPHAGILDPEACVGAHLDVAAALGAEIHHGEPVRLWAADGEGVRVETERASYLADRLVIAAGPWAGELLASLGLPLTVTRAVAVHFEPERPDLFDVARCPVYVWQAPYGEIYGLPVLPGQGLKVGALHPGEVCTPHTIRREIDEAEIEGLRAILDRAMPGAGGPVKWALTCIYTNTPDVHFVLDRHAAYPQVVYGCGFSGHGFKFASAIGEVLADLAVEGASRHEIGFLSARRFRQGAATQRA